MTPKDKQWWLDRVQVDPVTNCWIWQHATMPNGYGSITYKQRGVYSHRLVFELFIGEIPTGLHVLHSCDQRACCNPTHLHLGTNVENIAERLERNPNGRVLDKIKVLEIRAIGRSQTTGQIAAKYGITDVTVSHILLRKTWKHI